MSLSNRVTKLEGRLTPPGRVITVSYCPEYETYDMALERAQPYGPEDTLVVCALVDFCATPAPEVPTVTSPDSARGAPQEAEDPPSRSPPTYQFTSW